MVFYRNPAAIFKKIVPQNHGTVNHGFDASRPGRRGADGQSRDLERPEYAGCTVNFKTHSKSHKLKKHLNNAPEKYRIFPVK